jgi:hypothetical protein
MGSGGRLRRLQRGKVRLLSQQGLGGDGSGEPGIIEGESVIGTMDAMLKLIEGFLPGFAPFLV